MKRLLSMLAILCVAAATVTMAQQTPDLESLFARAQRQETIAADLPGAIVSYTEVIKAAGPTNAITPRAMFRLAECHRKLGHDEALGIYTAIVRDYPNSGEPYDTARARLDTMKAESPVAPFQPAEFELPVDAWGGSWGISPDGTSAAYLRRGGSQQQPDSDLVIHDLASRTDRVLASHIKGISAQISFSPDGSRVAAMIGNAGPAQSKPYRQLVVAGVTETATDPVTIDVLSTFEDAVPAWSPDGHWLPYLGPSADPNLSDVRVLDTQTGTSRTLGVAVFGRPDFTWFPDGTRLAFRAADALGETGDIHLVRVPTFAHDVVSAPAAITGSMRINGATADGRLVLRRVDTTMPNAPRRPLSASVGLFNPVDGAFVVTCEGANQARVRIGAEDGSRDNCLEVTRDGVRQLYWSAATKRLMIRDLATGNEHPLTIGAGEEHFGLLSPDERVQVFVSNRDGQWGVYAAALDQAPVAQPVKLTDLDNLPTTITAKWSDSGLVLGTQGGAANLFRVDMNPETGRSIGPVVRLTQDQAWNQTPAISPDGTRIGYWVRQGQTAVAVMNADGSNERLVTARQFGTTGTPGLRDPGYLAWLSGQDITFVSTLPDSNEVRRLTVNTTTGATSPAGVPLFQNPAWNNPASNWDLLQPTGELIYAWATDALGPFEFRARSIATGEERTLVRIPTQGCHLQNYVVAPDGKTLGYQLGVCTDTTQVRTIGVADLATGTIRTVISPATNIDIGGLSSDGRYLAVTHEVDDDYRPKIVEVATGDSWSLMPDAQQPALWNPLTKWAPDNSFLVFMQGGVTRVWRQWTNLTPAALAGQK